MVTLEGSSGSQTSLVSVGRLEVCRAFVQTSFPPLLASQFGPLDLSRNCLRQFRNKSHLVMEIRKKNLEIIMAQGDFHFHRVAQERGKRGRKNRELLALV